MPRLEASWKIVRYGDAMSGAVAVRWQDWDAKGIEHLVLREGVREIVAESVVVGSADDSIFAVRYRVRCDKSWRVDRKSVV